MLKSALFSRRLGVPATRLFSKIVKGKVEQPLLSTGLPSMNFPKFLMQDFMNPHQVDLPAFMDGTTNESRTFGELYSHTYSLAQTLRDEYKIGKDDCVAIWSPNHINYFTAFQGTALTDGFSMCINPLYTEEEAMYQVEITNAKVMIAHPYCMKLAKIVAEKRGIPLINIAAPNEAHGTTGITSLDSMVNIALDSIDQDSFGKQCKEDILSVPFSSGTTGRPKGVMLTHQNVISNVLQIMPAEGDYMKTRADGRRQSLLVPLPFFHIYGLVAGMFLPLYAGAKSIFMPAFDLVKFLEIIQEHKITRTHIVPPICLAMAKHPIIDNYDLSSLEVVMSGAAPLGGDVQKAMQDRLGTLVKQAWGMTELSPAGNIFDDEHLRRLGGDSKGSVGPLLPATEAKIVCLETGNDLDPTQEGELYIRGPQVMKGYYKNREATDEMLDSNGWLHTGDVCKFDEDGLLYITDRCKELIKYKGFQIAPAELEALILTIPEVMDVVVIPVVDEIGGEIPRAYVVKRPYTDITEETICDFVALKVNPNKKLRGGVRFTDVIPKSASGKILRRIQIQKDRESV